MTRTEHLISYRQESLRMTSLRLRKVAFDDIHRGNYPSALKAMTNGASPEPLIRTLDFVQRFSLVID